MKKRYKSYNQTIEAMVIRQFIMIILISAIIGCNSNKSMNNNNIEMQKEIEKAILNLASKESNSEYALKISKEYLSYYQAESEKSKRKILQLLKKYNDKTIEAFLGENGYPKQFTHMSLGHSMSDKTITPMLDNDGGIYPPDQEIGKIVTDPGYWSKEESDEHWDLRWKYHGLIFYAWLSSIWIEVEGYKSNIVVKTTENNSVMSWYLNDFQFDSHSKFHLEHDWRKAISNYNKKSINVNELLENLMKEYGR